MGLLVAAISALHVSVLILLFAATLDKVWWVQDGRSVSLWYRCVALQQHELRCEQLSAQPRLLAAQVLQLLSLFLSSISFLLFLLLLHVGPRRRLLLPPAVTQMAAGLAALSAFLLFILGGPGAAAPPRPTQPGGVTVGGGP